MRLYKNGRVVDENGICTKAGAPADELVHAASWSTLETFLDSRGNYRDFHHLGTRAKPTTKVMEFGHLYHEAILEPAKFAEIEPAPDFDRRKVPGLRALEAFHSHLELALKPQHINKRTKAGKAEFAEWEVDHIHHVVVDKPEDFDEAQLYLAELERTRGKRTASESDLERARAIRDAVMQHPKAVELLSHPDGEAEVELSWMDPTGIEIFAHPDYMCPTHALDLKGVRDPSPRAFTSQCEASGYYRQGALYTVEAWAERYGPDGDREFWNIVVRNDAPYEVACYRMDFGWLNDGMRQIRAALDDLKGCLETGDWRNGYEKEWSAIERPAWAAAKDLAFEEMA